MSTPRTSPISPPPDYEQCSQCGSWRPVKSLTVVTIKILDQTTIEHRCPEADLKYCSGVRIVPGPHHD